MRRLILATLFAGLSTAAFAQAPAPAAPPDPATLLAAAEAAGVEACAACHGMNGISIADGIPNLAGQKGPYITNQLRAFRSGTRVNQTMQAMAGQLDDEQIAAISAYFAHIDGGAGAARSAQLPGLVRTDFVFPADYKDTFTKYTTINFPAPRNQVRTYWANDTAIEAARAGQPLPDGSFILVEIFPATLDAAGQPTVNADGSWAHGDLAQYTAMTRETGRGATVPELLRNEDWNYAVFRADLTVNAGNNQASCLSCHVPLPATSFLFTLDALKSAPAQ